VCVVGTRQLIFVLLVKSYIYCGCAMNPLIYLVAAAFIGLILWFVTKSREKSNPEGKYFYLCFFIYHIWCECNFDTEHLLC